MNRNSNFITDIEKNKFTPVKEVKQFDNVRLSYELFANNTELDVTGSNISIRVLKADNTVVIQNTGFTINKNKVTLDLNNEVTKVAGIANIEIKVTKNNEQITTFATKLNIEKSVLNEVYAKKNLIEILVELDTKLDITANKINNLDTENSLAQTNINYLDARNNEAKININHLDARNDAATININDLDTENNEAVTNKNFLYTENSVAQMHLEELKKKTEVAVETKEELNEWLNNNKDIAKINERINNNIKEITNLKDSIAQNKPVVIAEDSPIGTIIWYSSKEILGKINTDIWKICDGQTLNKADFPELYELFKNNSNYTVTATTFNLPDLLSSKRFIRSIDDINNVGALENDENKYHTHGIGLKVPISEPPGIPEYGAVGNTLVLSTEFVTGNPNSVGKYTDDKGRPYKDTMTNEVYANPTITTNGGDESRPKNIQFIPLIKCKSRAKDIIDVATDVEQAKTGFNTLKEAMDSKATKDSIVEITEEISNIEEAVLDINNELEGARNGEVSLDARIEKDINKINDNIDNLSFLPFEGENIDIDNSLNGYTRDLVIKGRTLHNLKEDDFTIYTNNAVTVIRKIKPNTTYSFINNSDSEYQIGLFKNDSNASVLVSYSNNSNLIIYKTPLDISSFEGGIRVYFRKNNHDPLNGILPDKYKEIIVLEGDYTNKSIPKYFEGIKSVGELEENKISILSHGKNILNLKSEYFHFQKGITGLGTGNTMGLGNETRRCVFRIPAKDNTYYSISSLNSNIAIACSYKDGRYKYDGGWNNRSYFTGTDTGELFINIKKADNSPFNTKEELYELYETSKLQVEESQSISSFESYEDDKKDILLPFTDGLKSLPNGVSDEIKYIGTKYKINKKIKMRVLDGTEDWRKSSDSDRSNTLNFVTSTFDSEIKNGSPLICNKFINKMTWGTDEESCAIEAATLKLRFRILKSKLESEDIAGFKKYLRDLYNSGDPVIIYYELNEPVVYDLDKDLNLEVYKDKTYISSNNSIQLIISCKAPTDVQATISTLRENNKELEEENIKLKELSYKNEATNDIQQIDIDNNQMATVELFEMLIGGINTFKIKGGDNSMVEVYVSLILKGKKTLNEVPSIIRPKVEAMLKVKRSRSRIIKILKNLCNKYIGSFYLYYLK